MCLIWCHFTYYSIWGYQYRIWNGFYYWVINWPTCWNWYSCSIFSCASLMCPSKLSCCLSTGKLIREVTQPLFCKQSNRVLRGIYTILARISSTITTVIHGVIFSYTLVHSYTAILPGKIPFFPHLDTKDYENVKQECCFVCVCGLVLNYLKFNSALQNWSLFNLLIDSICFPWESHWSHILLLALWFTRLWTPHIWSTQSGRTSSLATCTTTPNWSWQQRACTGKANSFLCI